MGEATIEFQNPQEQLLLSALVDRFCSRTPNEFDPIIHVNEAREIVKQLVPKIKFFSTESFSWQIDSPPSQSKKSLLVGATDIGKASAVVDDQREKKPEKKTTFGKQDTYRIGAYRLR